MKEARVYDCPRSKCEDGARILGTVQRGRQIKFLLEPVVVDRALADDLIIDGRGARYAFTNSCVTANCAQWTGARCKAISSALSVYADANRSGAQVEQCFLLNSCRWRAQEGERACGVCPLVINDSQLHVGFNGKEIIVSTPDL